MVTLRSGRTMRRQGALTRELRTGGAKDIPNPSGAKWKHPADHLDRSAYTWLREEFGRMEQAIQQRRRAIDHSAGRKRSWK